MMHARPLHFQGGGGMNAEGVGVALEGAVPDRNRCCLTPPESLAIAVGQHDGIEARRAQLRLLLASLDQGRQSPHTEML